MSELQNHKVNSETDWYTSANYWAPLAHDNDDEESSESDQKTSDMVAILTGNKPSYPNTTVKQQMYNWLQKQFKLQPNAGMVLDSGATLHIVQREENLRCTGMTKLWHCQMAKQSRQHTQLTYHLLTYPVKQELHMYCCSLQPTHL